LPGTQTTCSILCAAVSGDAFSTPLPTTKTFTCILLAATVQFFLLILLLIERFKLALLLFVIHNRSWIAKSVALLL